MAATISPFSAVGCWRTTTPRRVEDGAAATARAAPAPPPRGPPVRAVLRGRLLADDDPVAVADRRVDHRVTGDAEHEQGALTDQFARQREDVLDRLLGQHRAAGGDPADARHGGGGGALRRRARA